MVSPPRARITPEGSRKSSFHSVFSRCDSVKKLPEAAQPGCSRTEHVGFGHGQDLEKKSLASEAQVFVCRHMRLRESCESILLPDKRAVDCFRVADYTANDAVGLRVRLFPNLFDR